MGLEKITEGAKEVGKFVGKVAKGAALGAGHSLEGAGNLLKYIGGDKQKEKKNNSYGKIQPENNSEKAYDLSKEKIESYLKYFKDSKSIDFIDKVPEESKVSILEKSLNLVDRMYLDRDISKHKYKKMKRALYNEMKKEIDPKYKNSLHIRNYLSRAAAMILFLFGILFSFRTPTITGNAIVEGSSFYSTNLIGILLVLVSFTLLLVLSKRN